MITAQLNNATNREAMVTRDPLIGQWRLKTGHQLNGLHSQRPAVLQSRPMQNRGSKI